MPGSLLQIERMLGENYAKHDLFVLRSDLFHAYFWSYEIKYYGKSLFLKNIEGKRRDELDAIVAPLQLEKSQLKHSMMRNTITILLKKINPKILLSK